MVHQVMGVVGAEQVRPPGPGEVTIEVRASGVNPTDYKGVSGAMNADPARLPLPEAFLAPGDAVIHLDHGVAALRGLDCVEGMDCLALEFAGGACKLVPVDELDRIWRYGAAAEAVSLDRLGGGAWEKRRAEAEAALRDTAAGLVELARAREAKAAPVLRAPRGAFARFCAGFPHTPTPDQGEAAEAALPQGAKAVATRLLAGARPTADNAYKVPLVERTIGAVIAEAKTGTAA